MTFGRDDDEDTIVDSNHQMIEDSSNSMVNMAITMDPFSAEQKLRKIDQMALDKQKAALLNKMPDLPTSDKEEDKYSDDDFEKEEITPVG